ncbi:hypothetical protein [Capillimicrobium parvum]|uniref:Uncharacterized protein n=1 Tax=Capillimicrobium parvum TaxID=2884022 RepID=A0A9E6XZE5_9ACTN|nr:hypothetical protein [Capillimicrobium parvum]UGS37151.1 hypothetical protein DSM104329_03566 [Capillimicrobium parvum]
MKSTSSPGTVASAADQLASLSGLDGVAILVVPFMTPAGAKAAARRGLSWIDLSGNTHVRDDDLYKAIGRQDAITMFNLGAALGFVADRDALADPSGFWLVDDAFNDTTPPVYAR